jgi:hypothetical protein
MRTFGYFGLVLVLVSLGPVPALGEVFRWQDATGAVTFSDRKPPDRKAEVHLVSWQQPGAGAQGAQGLGYVRDVVPTPTAAKDESQVGGKDAASGDSKQEAKAKEERRARALNDWLASNCGFEPGAEHIGGRNLPDTYRCDAPLPRELAGTFKQAKAGAAVELGCRGSDRCGH